MQLIVDQYTELRNQPSERGDAVLTLSPGAQLTLIIAPEAASQWCLVEVNESGNLQIGWVLSNYLAVPLSPVDDHPIEEGLEHEAQIELSDIGMLASRVFGDAVRAEAWLTRPNRSLSGQRPLDLAKDEPGATAVLELLKKIDHGIFG